FDRGRLGELAQADIVEQFQCAGVEAVEHGLGTPEIKGLPVLTRGYVLAEGTYADLSKDPRVKEAYLGAGHG
ncbi:MAG: hypothetical protein WAM83_23695, partial [Bradyrhizobium sp.]